MTVSLQGRSLYAAIHLLLYAARAANLSDSGLHFFSKVKNQKFSWAELSYVPRGEIFVNRNFLVFAFCHNGHRPNPHGQVLGVVTDSSSAGIPLPRVVTTSLTTNQSQNVVCDDRGSYLIRGVLPGCYKLSAQRAGWTTGACMTFP